MDFESIEDTLIGWLETVTGLPALMENRPRPHLDRLTGFVRISAPNVVPVGEDYVAFSEGSDPDALLPTVIGRREFTVTITAISRTQTPNRTGRYYAERIRISLKKPSVLGYLQENGLAVVVAGDTNNLDGEFAGRWESIGALEVTFSCAVSEDDAEIGTIGTVGISSTLKDPAGDLLPTPPNLEDEELTVS